MNHKIMLIDLELCAKSFPYYNRKTIQNGRIKCTAQKQLRQFSV